MDDNKDVNETQHIVTSCPANIYVCSVVEH
jgi:hypothetical protein